MPADLEIGRSPWSEQIASCSGEYAARLRENLRQLHNEVRLVVQNATCKTQIRYDVRAQPPNLKVGDTVWLYNPRRRPRFSPKLQTDWEGPYTVVELVNDVVVQIRKNTPRWGKLHLPSNRFFSLFYLGILAPAFSGPTAFKRTPASLGPLPSMSTWPLLGPLLSMGPRPSVGPFSSGLLVLKDVCCNLQVALCAS